MYDYFNRDKKWQNLVIIYNHFMLKIIIMLKLDRKRNFVSLINGTCKNLELISYLKMIQ